MTNFSASTVKQLGLNKSEYSDLLVIVLLGCMVNPMVMLQWCIEGLFVYVSPKPFI